MDERLQLSARDAPGSIPIWPVARANLEAWLRQQEPRVQAWVRANGFKADVGKHLAVPSDTGALAGVVLGIGETGDLWCYGGLPTTLPPGLYRIVGVASGEPSEAAGLGWALGSYGFARYRARPNGVRPRLVMPAEADAARVTRIAEATFFVRDLINTPAEDLGPAELAGAVQTLAERYHAELGVIAGDDLLTHGYPAIHAVGRASARAPRLIDLRWGDPAAKKVTLIGKGVCFDSGGLDIKTAAGMRLMKKDMGGAATVLGLARLIMDANLAVRLRVLIPAVENSVAGSAMRPGDVIRTRKGLTVEIGNTDAEGRVVMADALAEADRERPALLLDCATLTGAARVALGTDLPALFTDDDLLAGDLERHARQQSDPLWRLPLWAPYRELLQSTIADIDNTGGDRFAGAITAALFLKDFVSETRSWAHFDLYAWNDKTRPGRPAGGEAMALRTLYALMAARYQR
ncbi:MAG: leucyl aminopeptidase family protein [Alphaproteobacteria bacterium]|nr:leucyl aminopeptidase family protein [Alphaproteobacteria bacterium]